MMDLPSFLIRELEKPLPGKLAHDKMLRTKRPTPIEAHQQQLNPRESAVVVLLYPIGKVWNTVLILRQGYEGVHSGQISFPGGKSEKDDSSLEFTALRELHEELGVDPAKVEMLGQLSSLYIPPSNFIVQPFVGITTSKPSFVPDQREVDQVIETPVHRFFEPDVIKNTDLYLKRYNTSLNVHYFNIQDHMVWGATAMMISEFREITKPLFSPK
jgi:8-oxo-dGTP pyrophosphatase MutT (NUDIX family)